MLLFESTKKYLHFQYICYFLPGQKVAQKALRQLNSPSIADPDFQHRPFHPGNIGFKQELSLLPRLRRVVGEYFKLIIQISENKTVML